MSPIPINNSTTILVVDDNDMVLRVVTKMLTRIGHDVMSVEDGYKGMEIFKENLNEIVLTDYNMPGIDGVTFAKYVKKIEPNTKVVLLTGSGPEILHMRDEPLVVDRLLLKLLPTIKKQKFQGYITDEKYKRAFQNPALERCVLGIRILQGAVIQ